jgi:hypothetical protein
MGQMHNATTGRTGFDASKPWHLRPHQRCLVMESRDKT